MKYKGTIVQESLKDDRILNEFEFLNFRVTDGERASDRWHIFTVQASQQQIEKLSSCLKPEKWYSHFWNDDNVIAIFPGKVFRFIHSDKSTWEEAVRYGKQLGIPEEQLDFLIEGEHAILL